MSFPVSSPDESAWLWHWLLQRIRPRLKPRFNLSWLVAYPRGCVSTGWPIFPLLAFVVIKRKRLQPHCGNLTANQPEDPIKLVSVSRHASTKFQWLKCIIHKVVYQAESPHKYNRKCLHVYMMCFLLQRLYYLQKLLCNTGSDRSWCIYGTHLHRVECVWNDRVTWQLACC